MFIAAGGFPSCFLMLMSEFRWQLITHYDLASEWHPVIIYMRYMHITRDFTMAPFFQDQIRLHLFQEALMSATKA